MKKCTTNIWLIGSIFLAHLLMFITFENKHDVFWYLYTATMLFLISYSIVNEKIDDELATKHFMIFGIISGLILYIIFVIGNWLLTILPGSLDADVTKLYRYFSPTLIWHYLVLIFILVPGEEIFWRGYVQKKLRACTNGWKAIIIASILNASVFYYANNTALMLAAFVGSIFWGFLYEWKKSIPLLIISHLIFILLLAVFIPLY